MQKFNQSGVAHYVIPLGVMLVMAIAGVFTLVASHAATRTVPGASYAQPVGWDPGLFSACAKTTVPGQPYFYSTTSLGQYCGAKNYTIGVERETTGGVPCGINAGPVAQTSAINDGGPLSLQIIPGSSNGGNVVNLKTVFANATSSCSGQSWQWFSWIDHSLSGGGPMPAPMNAIQSFQMNYNYYLPDPLDASRMFALYAGNWDGYKTHIEIDLSVTPSWGKHAGLPKDITVYSPDIHYVLMDASALGISVPTGKNTRVVVNWNRILSNLASRGYITAPKAGWATSGATQSMGLGTETEQTQATNGPNANLFFTSLYSGSSPLASTPSALITTTPLQ